MDQINEIKQKLDIVDVVGSYVSLKKSGRNYKGLCPFHSEDSPSFMVSQELQIYKCFGCGEAGDMYKFVEKIEGVEFGKALEILADKAGVKLEKTSLNAHQDAQKKLLYEINHLACEYYSYLLTKHDAGKLGLKYLKDKRGLSDKTIKDFRLGFAPESWDSLFKALTKKGYKVEDLVSAGVVVKGSNSGYIDKFRGRVMFPLFSIDGKVVGFTGRTIADREPKYLNTGETAIFQKSNVLYALDKAKVSMKKEGCVFVEGQMDVISAHQAGITNVIASSGTAVTVGQLKIINRYTQDLVFCFDSDSAGEIAAQRAFELAEKEGFNIRVAVIPEGFKDIDEVIKADVNKAKSMIENSIPAYDYILIVALKKYDRNSAIGKKKIVESLIPVFSRLSNKVLLDHYTKRISEELNINENVVSELLSKKTSVHEYTPEVKQPENSPILTKLAKNSSEDYLIALLLKAPLDSQKAFLYKLESQDFASPRFQSIYTSLKSQCDNEKEFNIQSFIDTIDGNLKEVVSELYLWDLGNLSEKPTDYLQELNATFARVRKDTIKRELKNLTAQIKQAEAEKDSKILQTLTTRFKDLQKLYAETN